MSTILPAILEKTRQSFQDKAFAITRIPGVEKIHVDFADGQFVPNAMLDIEEFEPLNPAFEWEAHLMVREPQSFLDYQIVGFKKIILHYEAFANHNDLEQAIKKIVGKGLVPAVAVNPSTPVGELVKCAHLAAQFTLMSVVPGFQGAPFVSETTERLKELRKLLPNAILEVDGSVKLHNASGLAQAGADLLVVGSGLWENGDASEQFSKLRQAAAK